MSGPVRAEAGHLVVGDTTVPLIAGEVQFWRMDPSTWRPALEQVRSLGVPIVSTYLSWRRHEPRRGSVEWGSTDPRLDARRFIELCGEFGLYVHLKPGPWICAEEPGGGYPDWLLEIPGIAAQDAWGRDVVGYNPPFLHLVPSPGDDRYRDVVRSWFEAVWTELGDLRHPTGPVIAVQLDNEPSHCFQDALWFADHHPSAVGAFRRWLARRYGDVADLARAWGSEGAGVRTFDEVVPPGPPERHSPAREAAREVAVRGPVHDWIEFSGDALAEHLAFLRHTHDGLGSADLLPTVNIINHPVHDTPLRERTLRRVTGALAGVDQYYVPPLDLDDVARLALGAATARAAGEPIVWAPEMMAGIWRSPGEQVSYPDPTPAEQAAWWGAAEALGYQGFTAYMLVDRENWQYAPVDPRPDLSPFARPVIDLLARRRAEPRLERARPRADVLVAWHHPAAVGAYTVTGTARQPHVPWGSPDRRYAYDKTLAALRALVADGFVYDLWDTTDTSPRPGSVVFVPDGVPDDVVARLTSAGCHLVTGDDVASALRSAAVVPAVRVVQERASDEVDHLAVVHEGEEASWLHLVSWGPSTDARIFLRRDAGALVGVLGGERLVPGVDGAFPCRLRPGHQVLAVVPGQAT